MRIRTKRIMDRLSYQPEKHKQKFVKELRKKLSMKNPKAKPTAAYDELRVGAMNVQGLDGETSNALSNLVNDRRLDVSRPKINSASAIHYFSHHCTNLAHPSSYTNSIFLSKRTKF